MNIKIIYLFILIIFSISCASNRNWNKVNVVYKDNNEKEMLVSPAKRSYYNFIKAKQSPESRKEYLYPDIVEKVESDSFKYISLFFSEEEFGIESYGFGEVVAGNDVILVKTKFREKTCACKTSGTYFKGFFLVYRNEIQRIKTNKDGIILNIGEVYSFFDNYSETGLIKDINNVEDIIAYLININNQ